MPLSKHSLRSFLERQENFQGQINASLDAWQDLELDPAKSPLKLKLGLRRSSINSNLGANHCQNVLLSKTLMPKHQVQQVLGTESTNFIRDIMFQKKSLKRANRTLHIDWRQDKNTWFANAELSEGVFGNPIYQGVSWNVPKPIAEEIPLPEQLEKFLQLEASAIDTNTSPRVASIYGAWAYMDKGRAWGLKMNDRVYISSGENE